MKEKILVSALAKNNEYPDEENLHPDDWDTCKVIKHKVDYFDQEKGYVTYKVVVQRLSDGKYFKFNYDSWGDVYEFDKYADEVEKKVKTVEKIYFE